MRSLIRPFLFAVARLGLFLAVVGWGAAGMFNLQLVAAAGNAGTVFTDQDGWTVMRLEGIGEWEFSVKRNVSWLFGALGRDAPVMGKFVRIGHLSFYLFVRHWLITSTFLVFNLLLHFIYRKRPEAEPCAD